MCSISIADKKADPRLRLLPCAVSQVFHLRTHSQSYDMEAYQFVRREHLLLWSLSFRVYCYSVAIYEYTLERSQKSHLQICASSQRCL